MGDHHVWDVCVMVKAHTTINIEQSAVFSTGEYILRIENLNEGHTILPIHKFISGVFTLLNENRQAINVMEFEVKRNSAFEKHFKIAATDFFIDAQGEQCEVVVANSNESKCLFIQLQLTSHSNVNKMFVGAKIKAFKENQVVQVLHSNASQNKIEQQRVLARTSSTIKHAFVPDKEPKPPQIISSTTPSVVSPALTHSNLTAHTSSYSLEPLPSPVIEHIVPSSPCPGVPPQHACAMDASTNTTPTSTLSTSQQVMTYQPATVTPSHTYPTIMGRTHNGTYSDVDDNTTAPSDTSSNPSDISSTGSGDEMQTSMIYFKAFKLHRKNSQLDTIQLTEKGNYVLVIERQDTIKDKLKNIQNISFSCHWVLSVCGCGLRETKVIKESFNNSALGGRKKIVEEFTLTYPLAALKVELNGHCTLGSIGVVVTLTRTKFPKPDSPNNGEVAHARSRTQGELVWAVSSIEIGRQTSRCFSVEFTQSGRYYFVVEKLDKTYGSTRELGVKGILHTHNGNSQCEVLLFEHSVGGNKNKPLKWKSEPFLAPASSTLELNVQSFALIGNITFSLRLRKVPGLSAEQEKLHQQVVFGILLLGGFFLLNVIFRILNWVLDLGVHLNCLLFSVKITLGHLILLISLVWLKSNRAIVLQQVAKMQDKFEQVFYKFKTISSISNRANIYDFIKKVKAMSRAGKLADKVRWEQEKMANIHE